MRKIFTVLIFIFLFSAFANAQAMTSYLFVEVVDSNQKPVSEATVAANVRSYTKQSKTDENGKFRVEFLDMGRPKFSSQFTISNPDYYPFYDFGGINGAGSREVKIELLKIPKTKKERKVLGDEQFKRDFFTALQKGDVETVRKSLKSGVNPNVAIGDLRGITGYGNLPAIMFSVMLGDVPMIKTLLEAGADIRKKDEFISHILFHYFYDVRFRDYSVDKFNEGLKYLINAGANVNENEHKYTPLMAATDLGYVETVKILIANGADVNVREASQGTALTIARKYQEYHPNRTEYQEIIQLLKKAGAKE